MEPLVSIILLDWNGLELVKQALPTIKELNYKNYELIFVDNGSRDNASIEYVKSFFPSARIIKNTQNIGYAGALNKVVPLARGEYLFFIQNDVKLNSNCLKELVYYAEEDPQVAICVPKQFSYDGKYILNFGIGMDIFGYPFYTHNLKEEKVFYADGAAFFVRKKVFLELEGFDEKHVAFAEDIDLCWRMWLKGYKLRRVPSAIVYHMGGATIKGSIVRGHKHITSILRRYLTERNTLRNLIKNYSSSTLFIILPFYLIMFTIEMLFFLFLGYRAVARDVYLKALMYNIINLQDTIKKRKKIQRERVISDWKIFKKIMLNKFYKWEVFKRIGIPLVR